MKQRRIIPPVYFLISLLLMFLLHYLFPIADIIPRPYNYSGIVFIIVGIIFGATPPRLFIKAKTTLHPFEEPEQLVTEGVYRYSRNPMYLALALVLIGTSLLQGCLSSFFIIPFFVWTITNRFIINEEKKLERRFGGDYLRYKQKVRRWI
ncbi:MAG: isoprenylcysteine carboxylmethyltransferase family protein [Candidatus Schekmanbacteria bacterium]|nr:isoprenylcysteine carboxylmethyltransferase family protein [Candidatus Schekmanbacteria bacterium]